MKTKDLILETFLLLLVGIFLLGGWTYTYDTATPLGSASPSTIDDQIRNTKAAIQERMNIEHVFDLTGTEVSHANSGKHTDITCTSVTSTGAISGTTGTFSGAVSGTTITASDDLQVGLVFIVEAATGNTAVAGTFDVTGNIDPSTFETTNGGFLDEDDMASDAADKVASQQSIKAYVDATSTWTPSSYAGEESITFPNGLIMKMGQTSSIAGTGTEAVAFAVSFTSLVSVVITPEQTTGNFYEPPSINSVSVDGFTVKNNDGDSALIAHWIAIGH